VLAIIIGLGFWFGRRRRAKQDAPPIEAEGSQDFKPPPRYRSVASMPMSPGAMTTNNEVYEAPTLKPRAELDTMPQKYESHFVELPTDSRN